MNQGKVLVVDDEEDIVELVSYTLSREGFKVVSANTGETALQIAKREKPDLIVLDLMLPGVSGLDVCRAIRSSHELKSAPIVILSAKGDETDVVLGLELGADDYITKPFSPKILIARVRAALRRKKSGPPPDQGPLVIDALSIDWERHEVTLSGAPLDLTATEFKLLRFLASNQGKVFTRLQIVHAVHGTDYPVTDRSVDVQIVGLRRKLGEFGDRIETIRGVGYRFRESESGPAEDAYDSIAS